ncbi:MAG: Hydroxypyruvate isomerase, partial [uncultured Thermomicrobiales bacterium]
APLRRQPLDAVHRSAVRGAVRPGGGGRVSGGRVLVPVRGGCGGGRGGAAPERVGARVVQPAGRGFRGRRSRVGQRSLAAGGVPGRGGAGARHRHRVEAGSVELPGGQGGPGDRPDGPVEHADRERPVCGRGSGERGHQAPGRAVERLRCAGVPAGDDGPGVAPDRRGGPPQPGPPVRRLPRPTRRRQRDPNHPARDRPDRPRPDRRQPGPRSTWNRRDQHAVRPWGLGRRRVRRLGQPGVQADRRHGGVTGVAERLGLLDRL